MATWCECYGTTLLLSQRETCHVPDIFPHGELTFLFPQESCKQIHVTGGRLVSCCNNIYPVEYMIVCKLYENALRVSIGLYIHKDIIPIFMDCQQFSARVVLANCMRSLCATGPSLCHNTTALIN